MASLNPFSSPNSGNKLWVDQLSKTLQTQLAVTIDTPPVSIFEIPKTLKFEKLEAYIPQRVGLGPYHHFQPELYKKIEQTKLTSVKRLLKPHKIRDCQLEVVEKVKAIVPIVSACYESYLSGDEDTLAWLFAIDGMFLLDQVDAYPNHCFSIGSKDLFMLENQIPLLVLNEIQKALQGKNAQDQKDYLESKFRFICNSHSPFHLSKDNIDFDRVHHLLDFMYHSIVENELPVSTKVGFQKPNNKPFEKDAKLELLEAVIKFARLIPGAQPFLQIVELVKPKSPKIDEEKKVDEIKVPSVSELGKIAGVKFRLSPRNEGIRNINFVQGKERFVYLPLITLNVDSEVILRNLVAYEKLMAKSSIGAGYGLEVTEYVDFMCGIIDNAKDVKLLREEKIIQGDLSDEEIVKMFNGISRSYEKLSVETKLRKTVTQLNNVYESTPRVWVQRSVEKQFRTTAKILTFLVSISGAVILIRELYFKVYGLNPPHLKLVHFLQTKLSSFVVFLIARKGPDAIA